ncbi:MAG: sel1 repeat family protein [Betaproteobacteria bacterium]|nr:sel1 repeat family protein [Betaproteobacteria bacterium]
MSLVHIYMRITGKLLVTLLLTFAVSVYGQSMSQSPEDQEAQENLAQMRMFAESGDANAQYDLAWMYDTGGNNKILAKDTRKAAEWYEKAAVQGHVKAQAGLGMLYVNGDGVPRDYVKGVDWLQKAAVQGNADAQLNLGWLYRDGKGIPKDATRALEWWQNAAERGFAHAQFTLGVIYNKGEIVPRDVAKAVEYWQLAVTQGYPDAQFNLGSMYYFGEGVPKDVVKAVDLWQRAAAHANTDAQYNLALAYYLGSGKKKDELLAYVWSNLAVEYGGNEHAKKLRDSITLTSDQREMADKMFSNWQIGKIYQ